MTRMVFFVFNGDPMCFVHVLLNALDMKDRGAPPKVVLEGASTKLIAELDKTDHPLNQLWRKVLGADLVEGACRACAGKTGSIEAAERQGIALLGDMSGHPSIAGYREAGFEILTF